MTHENSTENRPWRLFVGIVPSDEVRARLARVSRELRTSADAAKIRASWERPEKMHVTVKFLGNVGPGDVARLQAALDAAAAKHRAFAASLEGIGRFPPRGDLRILFSAVAQGNEAMGALAVDVDAACSVVGVAREQRRFHGHVTLARVKHGPRQVELASLVSDAACGSFDVTEIVLFRSELGPEGSTHHVLSRHPLIRAIGSVPSAPT